MCTFMAFASGFCFENDRSQVQSAFMDKVETAQDLGVVNWTCEFSYHYYLLPHPLFFCKSLYIAFQAL